MSIFGGAASSGLATEARQSEQIAQLASILSEVTGAAKDVSVLAVTAAVEAVGDGATVAQVVARLDTDAVTQAAILAELEAQGIDLETAVTTLATIENEVDELEPDLAATRVAVESIDAKTPALGPVPYTAARAIIHAQCVRPAKSASLAAASTSFLISAAPATLRRLTWRYSGGGIKYIAIFDQTSIPAVAANWMHWYWPMNNGAGVIYQEWPEGLYCPTGIVVGVSASEPTGTIVPSVAATENFILIDYSLQ